MLTLEHFSQRQTEWIKITIYLGADKETAKEVVQQMYLKIGEIELKEGNLDRFLNYNGAINTVWVFKVLQNLYIDYNKKKTVSSEYYDLEYEVEPVEEQEIEYHIIISKMKLVILSFNEYEQILLELYFVHNRSFREISKRTGIGVHSIFNTIKNAKEKIKKAIEKDYRTYRDSGSQTINWGGRHNREDNGNDWD